MVDFESDREYLHQKFTIEALPQIVLIRKENNEVLETDTAIKSLTAL